MIDFDDWLSTKDIVTALIAVVGLLAAGGVGGFLIAWWLL